MPNEAQTVEREARAEEQATEAAGTPLIQHTAETVAAIVESAGFKTIPLYFAARLVAGDDGLSVIGKLRFHFPEAVEDARSTNSAVAFVVQIARTDNDSEMKCHAVSLEERERGMAFGALRRDESGQLLH